MGKKENTVNFEEAISRLEEIVKILESETISLEKSLELFEEGMTLTKKCREKLKDAEGKIKKLSKIESGKVEVKEGG
ncbi:MAG: exodeoxyribonuclease VII small subunit [Candidatus Marinimicrobia bacterium]|nr:exodeoxyribonuclease VII small subunit [Candidatus Neomarinimicrobiota bacterium]MBL7046862.1 exodeoxyribonuclease VII small subunit [Candidatus Neomarinimicrobiota bacterium]